MEHAMLSTLVTGANRGIGLEFVRQYLANGWQVYAACRDPSSASELHRLADTGNHNLRIVVLDVTDPFSIKAAAAELDGQAIDLLLNNAGVMGARDQTIGNIDYDAWAKVLDANTMGPMRVSEAFIVTLTSGMGSLADNTSGGSTAYRSSKAAVNMVMRSMAIDLAPRGIICVVVNPGWVQTAMGGPHAKITPAESVTKLKRLIETLGPPQSGKFFNYDGKEYPW
jgi:NAD(P)-dependent dehydrogenase (short-subunit alcohol dehydrogenase family)